jgi:hypothetical protein
LDDHPTDRRKLVRVPTAFPATKWAGKEQLGMGFGWGQSSIYHGGMDIQVFSWLKLDCFLEK